MSPGFTEIAIGSSGGQSHAKEWKTNRIGFDRAMYALDSENINNYLKLQVAYDYFI